MNTVTMIAAGLGTVLLFWSVAYYRETARRARALRRRGGAR